MPIHPFSLFLSCFWCLLRHRVGPLIASIVALSGLQADLPVGRSEVDPNDWIIPEQFAIGQTWQAFFDLGDLSDPKLAEHIGIGEKGTFAAKFYQQVKFSL
jgi:hypothetical protein